MVMQYTYCIVCENSHVQMDSKGLCTYCRSGVFKHADGVWAATNHLLGPIWAYGATSFNAAKNLRNKARRLHRSGVIDYPPSPRARTY